MKTMKLQKKRSKHFRNLEVPTTTSDWELPADLSFAANQLTEALCRAMEDLVDDRDMKKEKATEFLMRQHIEPVVLRLAKTDSRVKQSQHDIAKLMIEYAWDELHEKAGVR